MIDEIYKAEEVVRDVSKSLKFLNLFSFIPAFIRLQDYLFCYPFE
jgi:hypothetical protein